MRAKDKFRLGAIRLALSEIKRVEVDERIDLDDERVTAILDKMVKQRRESIVFVFLKLICQPINKRRIHPIENFICVQKAQPRIKLM